MSHHFETDAEGDDELQYAVSQRSRPAARRAPRQYSPRFEKQRSATPHQGMHRRGSRSRDRFAC